MFANVIKCVDDIDDVHLKESEYDLNDFSYRYIFSDVISRDLGRTSYKDNIISFYADRKRKVGIERYIFNVFNDKRRRNIVEYDIYRLKEKYDNGIIENGLIKTFKDEKSTIEDDGGGFVEDKESEDGILENGFINTTKTNKIIDKIEDTLARKVTDYGASENIIVRFKIEIKDLLYDKFQKMLGSINDEIIINKTMLVDMGNYRELLQGKYIMVTTPDDETHRFENYHLRNRDSLLDKPGIGSMLGDNENDLLVDDYWKLYSEHDNELYINELEKKLSQDIYNKPILSFNPTKLNKDNLKLYNEQDYFELYKDDIDLDYPDTIFSGSYRESSDMTLRDDYLFLLKDVQNLFVNKENIQVIKIDGEIDSLNANEFGRVHDREAYLIDSRILRKIENTASIKPIEDFLFHPLDGVYFVDTNKWFSYEKILYQKYSGFMTYGSDKQTYLNGYGEFVGEIDDDFKLYILNNFSISGEGELGHIEDTIKAITKFDNDFDINEETISVSGYGGDLEILFEMILGKYNKGINLDYGQILIEKYYHRVVDGFENIFFRVTQRYTDARKDDIWAHKKIREIYNNTSVIMMNRSHRDLYMNKDIFVSDTSREIFKYNISTFAYVSNKYINISPTDILVDTISKSMMEEFYMMQLYKIEKGMSSSLEEVQISRTSYKFHVNTDFMYGNKESAGFEINENYSVETSKESRKLDIERSYIMAGEYPRDTIYSINGVWANRIVYDMSTKDTSYNIYRTNNNIEATNTILGVFKKDRKIDSDSKSTQVYKEDNETFTDFIEEFLHRDFIKEIDFNEYLWIGTSYKETNNTNDYIVNFKKVNKDTLKNDIDISVANPYRPTFKLNDNNMFDVSEKEMFSNNPIIQFSKRYIKLLEDKHAMVDKVNPNISLSENEVKRVSRETYGIMNYNNFRWVHTVLRDTYINDVTSSGVDLSDKGALYYDTELVIDKDLYEMYVDSNTIFSGVGNKNSYQDYNILNVSKMDYSINPSLGYVGVGRHSRDIYKDEDSVRISKVLRETNYLSTPIAADKVKAGIGSANDYLFVGKLLNEITKPSQNTFVNKVSGTINYNKNGLFAKNISKGIVTDDTWELASRSNIGIDVERDIDFISKQRSDMNIEYSEIEVEKSAKDIYIDTFTDFIYRESLNEIRLDNNLWFKYKYRSLNDANDYIVNLEKLKAILHENDTITRFNNSDKQVFEDINYNNVGIYERELFENEVSIGLSKKDINIFEDNILIIDKFKYKVSVIENKPISVASELYSASVKDTFKWVNKNQIKTYISETANVHGNIKSRNTSYFEDMIRVNKFIHKVNTDGNGVFVRNSYRNIFINKESLSISKEMNYINIDSKYILVSRASRKAYTDNSIIGARKSSKSIGTNNTLIGATKEQRKSWSENTYLFIKGKYRDIEFLEQSILINKISKDIGFINNEFFVDKISENIFTNISWKFTSKSNRNTQIYKGIDFAYKSNINISKNKDTNFVYKLNTNIFIDKGYDFAYKINTGIDINKGYDFISKISNKVSQNNSHSFAYKVKSGIHVDEIIDFADISSKELGIEYGGIAINKNQKETHINSHGEFLNRDFDWDGSVRLKTFVTNNFFVALGYKDADLLYKPMTLNKGSKSVNPESDDMTVTKSKHKYSIGYNNMFIGKSIHHTDYIPSNIETSKYIKYTSIIDGYIGADKKRKVSSVNDCFEWIKKGNKTVSLINNYIWISKGIKDLNNSYEFLVADKYNKETFINYSYYYVDKNKKPTGMIDSNIYISKNGKTGTLKDFIYVNKNYINAYTIGNLFVNISYKNMNFALENNISISNKNNYIDFHGLLSLSQALKHGGVLNNLSLFKYRSHGKILEQEFLYKPLFDGFLNEEVALEDPVVDTYIDNDLCISEYIPNSYIFNNEWANQERKKSNLTSTSETVDQEIKEFQVEYQDLFIYHVSGDDASKPGVDRLGIIDELILPHKDYKYSDYLKELILPDGSINMRYVKSFDADTGEYTVTLPIEHPLNVYTDVGRDYLDVDVAILDMTIHMLKEIWKQKMFRYVAMTAQDSLKDMLKELDKNIKNIYENDPAGMKEARRCLQLFRWYSEMAILNNCEYILKFYGRQIEVDFVEKDLKEIEDLIELNNMHISDNFVLEPIDSSKPASVVLSNNQKNLGAPLNISFKLYNVNRNSSISIDDENVENTNYKQGIHDVSIDIKKKVVISFEPSGEYQSMVIANLKATNYSTSDFSIKYKGVFGETNKVMQDLLDRVLVVGEVSDDLRKRLGDVAPVTIALDKLITYFELHHENKEKGRRLITRK